MLLAACGFLYHAIASRGLGVESYGSLYALISTFATAGLPGAIIGPVIVRFSAEFKALRDDSHLRGLASGIVLLAGVFGSAVLLLSIVLAVPIGHFLRIAPWLVPLIGGMTAFGFLSGSLRSFVQGTQAYSVFGASCVAEGILKVCAIGAFIALGLGVAWGAIAFIIGFAGSATAIGAYLWRRFAAVEPAVIKYDWKRIAIAGAAAAALTIATTLIGSLDVVLVKHYFDPSQAGIYSAASLVGKILLYFVGFIPTILLPQATDRHSRGERTRVVLASLLGTFIAVSICGLLFFKFFGIFVLHALVGHQFDAAAPLIVSYGAAMVFLSFIGALGTYGIATHRLAFSVPLVICAIGVLGAIALYHPTLAAVVRVLLTGNLATMCVVAVCLAVQGMAGERARLRAAA